MNQAQKDKAWKVFDFMFLVACVLFLIINSRGVLRWFMGEYGTAYNIFFIVQ